MGEGQAVRFREAVELVCFLVGFIVLLLGKLPKSMYWEKGVAIMNKLSKLASITKVYGTMAYIGFLVISGLATNSLSITVKR
jgi:hypothetical protein